MATEVETNEELEESFLNGEMDEGEVTAEVVEGETPPLDEEETTEESEDSGPARDEHGRFVKKEAEGEAPVEVAAQDTGAPAVAATPEAPPEIPALPFSFKVNGQEIPIEGAEYRQGIGLTIPDMHVNTVRQLLSEGMYYKRNWREQEQTAEKRGYDKALSTAPEIQQAKALSETINRLFENPEELAAAYENWATMGPMYREKAMRELAEKQLAELRQGSQREQEEQQNHRLEQEKQHTLTETIGELKAVPDLKILTPEDWQLIDKQVATLNARGGLFVTKEDGVFLDVPAIEEIALHVLNVRKQVVKTAKEAEEAAKFNQANKPKAQAQVPVTTPRKGSAPKPKTSTELDAKAIREAFLSGDLDLED